MAEPALRGQQAVDGLLGILDLEQVEEDIFRGRSPEVSMQRVFGWQVAGQALVAAGRTVPAERPVHSLHAYFLRPGDPSVPIVYLVDRSLSLCPRRGSRTPAHRPTIADTGLTKTTKAWRGPR